MLSCSFFSCASDCGCPSEAELDRRQNPRCHVGIQVAGVLCFLPLWQFMFFARSVFNPSTYLYCVATIVFEQPLSGANRVLFSLIMRQVDTFLRTISPSCRCEIGFCSCRDAAMLQLRRYFDQQHFVQLLV